MLAPLLLLLGFKGTVSRDFWPFFFGLKIRLGPHMNRRKQFRELFRFCDDIREKFVSAWSMTMPKPVSVQSTTMLTPDFRTLRSNISAKTKHFAIPLLTVHMGPTSNLLSQKNGRKSRDTVPFRSQKFAQKTFFAYLDFCRMLSDGRII